MANTTSKKTTIIAVLVVVAVAIALLFSFASCSVRGETMAPEKPRTLADEAAMQNDPSMGMVAEDNPNEQVSASSNEPQEAAEAALASYVAQETADGTQRKTAPEDNKSQSQLSPSAPQKHWVEDTEQVWVEETAAWTEQEPIYGTKEVSICNICNTDVTGNTTAHGKAHMLAGEGSGHHSETRQTVVGYNTVSHPASGHWETRVVGGHWQ